MIPALLISLALMGSPAELAELGPWEGWEPKDTLPTQALETLEEQALPEPTPEPEPVVTDPVERWRPLVESYDWNADVMLRVMRCESGGEPTAQNSRSTATGLFQIMWSIWYADQGPRSDLHDPYLNTQIAFQVWEMQGLGAWNASRYCWG